MRSEQILNELISFETVSQFSNMGLIEYVQDLLNTAGVESTLLTNEDGTKANLFATIGPKDRGGVMLSGHTDVVPVEGQAWTKPPFELTTENGRYYGRGATDMKGFVACALAAALDATKRDLKTPLHLAFSYDEEIGCQGVRSLIELLRGVEVRPAMCIVGEPTSLVPATGHKGKVAMKAICKGLEGHSALAPFALNAIHMATDLVHGLRILQDELRESGTKDDDYDVPYTTIHVGRILGGQALNIVPNRCEVLFEVRNLAQDDPKTILSRFRQIADQIVESAKATFDQAEIILEPVFSYPGLDTAQNHDVVQFVKALTGANSTKKVAFGTEGGLFDQEVGIPTVVCGPGSMDQGHKPDEFIEISQMARCDAMMRALLDRLETGL